MAKKKDTTSTTTALVPTPGMAQVQDAIQFVAAEVLQPDVKPIKGTAKVMADQAAAMMIQDMRSFLQGNEQVLTVGIARALSMIMSQNPDEQAAGAAALAAMESLMTQLPTFATSIGTAATGIVSGFE